VCACRLSIYDDDDYNRIKPRERVGQWDGHTHTVDISARSFVCVSFFGLCIFHHWVPWELSYLHPITITS
jgi:hypothetical protein